MTRTAHGSFRGGRTGAVALAVGGVLFALFPLLRPWPDKLDTATGLVAAFGSP